MLDDIRNHDPNATENERGWMDTSPLEALVRVVTVVSISIAIGVAASQSLEMEPRPATAVVHASR